MDLYGCLRLSRSFVDLSERQNLDFLRAVIEEVHGSCDSNAATLG
jgi:hypothetical protein